MRMAKKLKKKPSKTGGKKNGKEIQLWMLNQSMEWAGEEYDLAVGSNNAGLLWLWKMIRNLCLVTGGCLQGQVFPQARGKGPGRGPLGPARGNAAHLLAHLHGLLSSRGSEKAGCRPGLGCGAGLLRELNPTLKAGAPLAFHFKKRRSVFIWCCCRLPKHMTADTGG